MLTIDTYVHQIVPMQPPGAMLVPAVATDGTTSLHDGLVIALLRPAEPARRHLIIAGIEGGDRISAADAAAVRDVARQSDAVLHVVERESSQLGDSHNQRSRSWGALPVRRGGFGMVAEAAAVTGGTVHPVGIFGDRNLVREFKEIVDRFRGGYVLRYSPEGVKRDGWHEIVVSVPKVANAVVRARRGYFMETPAASGETTRDTGTAADARAPGPVAPSTLDDFAAIFDRGDDAALQTALRRTRDLRRVIREYREGGTPWPATPKRDAIFVLELAASGLIGRDSETRADAAALLQAHHDLVRAPFGADEFECAWYGAAAATLQGGLLAGVALQALPRELERCPADARLHLARAIVSDQLASTTTARAGVSREVVAEMSRDEVLQRYEAAMTYPAVSAEARVRAGWFAYRIGRRDKAIEYLDGIPPAASSDPVVPYFGHLIRGQVLRAQGRFDEAIAAFRAALGAWPGAQSARVGLMTLLVAHGDRSEAESLAEAVADRASKSDRSLVALLAGRLPQPFSVADEPEEARTMTARVSRLTWCLAALALLTSADAQESLPTFRSTADAVRVDVSVQRGGRPVAGLTIADFDLVDEGVAQTITSVSYERLPIDVTVALDVSASVSGRLLADLRQSIEQLEGRLREGDRLKLIAFNMRVRRNPGLHHPRRRHANGAGERRCGWQHGALRYAGGRTDVRRARRPAPADHALHRRIGHEQHHGPGHASRSREPHDVDAGVRGSATVGGAEHATPSGHDEGPVIVVRPAGGWRRDSSPR